MFFTLERPARKKTESYWVNPEVSQAIECYDLWPTSNSNSGGIHYLNIPSSSFFTNQLSTSTIVKDLCKLNWYAICVLRPRHQDSKFYPSIDRKCKNQRKVPWKWSSDVGSTGLTELMTSKGLLSLLPLYNHLPASLKLALHICYPYSHARRFSGEQTPA